MTTITLTPDRQAAADAVTANYNLANSSTLTTDQFLQAFMDGAADGWIRQFTAQPTPQEAMALKDQVNMLSAENQALSKALDDARTAAAKAQGASTASSSNTVAGP